MCLLRFDAEENSSPHIKQDCIDERWTKNRARFDEERRVEFKNYAFRETGIDLCEGEKEHLRS